MKALLLIFILSVCTTFNANASSGKHYEGRYIAKYVQSRTQETARLDLGEAPSQQGKFVLYFIHEAWHELTEQQQAQTFRVLLMRGTITGKVDLTTGLASHILTSDARTGAMFTGGDILMPISGDYACSTREVLQANELLTFTHGTGKFDNLVGGKVLVSGTANTCYGHPEFLQNTFNLADQVSYLEFSPK